MVLWRRLWREVMERRNWVKARSLHKLLTQNNSSLNQLPGVGSVLLFCVLSFHFIRASFVHYNEVKERHSTKNTHKTDRWDGFQGQKTQFKLKKRKEVSEEKRNARSFLFFILNWLFCSSLCFSLSSFSFILASTSFHWNEWKEKKDKRTKNYY